MTESIGEKLVGEPPARWDALVAALQSWRRQVGSPSYGEIAERVAAARVEAGTEEYAARVAKSTVYDVFKPGRARINLALVREIAVVLGAGDHVEGWIAGEAVALPAAEVSGAEPVEVAHAGRRAVLAVLLGSIALNMLGRVVVDWLHLPIYLDMVGTAVAALALGPWLGAVVGGATNGLGALHLFNGTWVSLPFGIVNVAGALVWGYGIRRLGFGRSLPRFFLLNLVVALACSLIAVPILVFVFGGSVGSGQDTVTQTFLDLGNGLLEAVGFSNLLTSGIDKVISGFVALVVLTALPGAFRRDFPLARKLHD